MTTWLNSVPITTSQPSDWVSFVHDLRASLGVGRVILEQDLDRAAVDPAALVDKLQRGLRGAFVPAPVAAPMPVRCSWKPILIGAACAAT